MPYHVEQIIPADSQQYSRVIALLESERLHLDSNLDCTYGLFSDSGELMATGSAYKNTLRCLAVRKDAQGEGLLPLLMTELIADRNEHGFFDLFIYTKQDSAFFFEKLGFYPIASVEGKLVFLENKRNGFAKYLAALQKSTPALQKDTTTLQKSTPAAAGENAAADDGKNIGAIVMNANPFTKGHLFLIEQAAAVTDRLHLFMVSDNSSAIPFSVRERLIKENTAAFSGLVYHRTDDYLISSATFPAYFLKDSDEAIRVQAALDAALFTRIADTLHITHRFVGDEPFSRVTGLYNRVLQELLPAHGIALHIIPRVTAADVPISASHARALLQHEDWTALAEIVPPATLRFFQSPEGTAIINKLKMMGNLTHY